MQLAAIIVSLVLTAVGVALFSLAVAQIYRVIRLGQPVPAGTRTDDPVSRSKTLAREFARHTRMNKWGVIGVAHWFVAVGFLTLALTIVNAYGQLFKADWILPWIGTWLPYELYIEFIATLTTLGIITLIVIRLLNLPSRAGRKSRFAGSTAWQAYFVEYVVLVIGLAIMTLRGLEGALHGVDHYEAGYFASYPLVAAFRGLGTGTLQNLVYAIAMIKLSVTMIWAIMLGLNTTMGVAWHRFLAFPNIWFKRNANGAVALGALQPMTSGGVPIDFEDPGEDDHVRRLPGRALLLEGHPRLLHLHRVRPLPVAVPGLEHRQAAVAQAADHEPARPRPRQGPLPAGRRRQGRRGRGARRPRSSWPTCRPPPSPRPSAR